MIAVQDFAQPGYVVMSSRYGYIKKTALEAFSNPRTTGLIACLVEEGDELMTVAHSEGANDIILCARDGKSIRFSEREVRSMGRTARGVKGISLEKGDRVVSMDIIRDETGDILGVTENGFGKRTGVKEYRRQSRAGKGVINIKTTRRNGKVMRALHVQEGSEVIIITEGGKIIRLEASRIRKTLSRSTQGVKLIELGEDDRVADLTLVPREDVDEDEA
jgi:DNA gyrase subunit A